MGQRKQLRHHLMERPDAPITWFALAWVWGDNAWFAAEMWTAQHIHSLTSCCTVDPPSGILNSSVVFSVSGQLLCRGVELTCQWLSRTPPAVITCMLQFFSIVRNKVISYKQWRGLVVMSIICTNCITWHWLSKVSGCMWLIWWRLGRTNQTVNNLKAGLAVSLESFRLSMNSWPQNYVGAPSQCWCSPQSWEGHSGSNGLHCHPIHHLKYIENATFPISVKNTVLKYYSTTAEKSPLFVYRWGIILLSFPLSCEQLYV